MQKNTVRLFFLFAAFLIVCAFIWLRSQVATGTPERVYVNQCRTGLNQAEWAKATWAADHHKNTNDLVTWDDLVGADRYLRGQPTCNRGGIYTLGRIGIRAKCSIPEHNL